jgi:hypothetical protein
MQKIMTISSQNDILSRIDAIARELEDLRRSVLKATPAVKVDNLTDKLLGALGSESISNYDYNLDWERFDLI